MRVDKLSATSTAHVITRVAPSREVSAMPLGASARAAWADSPQTTRRVPAATCAEAPSPPVHLESRDSRARQPRPAPRPGRRTSGTAPHRGCNRPVSDREAHAPCLWPSLGTPPEEVKAKIRPRWSKLKQAILECRAGAGCGRQLSGSCSIAKACVNTRSSIPGATPWHCIDASKMESFPLARTHEAKHAETLITPLLPGWAL